MARSPRPRALDRDHPLPLWAQLQADVLRRLLGMPAGMAAFEIHRLGCLRNRPVEWRETMVRGDRFTVTAHWSDREGYRMDVASGPEHG